MEGKQPLNLRTLTTGDLEALEKRENNGERTYSRWDTTTENRPDRAMLTLHADAALEWRMIGLEILKE
jgi:hypothetical protein